MPNLREMNFHTTTLLNGQHYFRAVRSPQFIFQSNDIDTVSEGRFNKQGEYCFYLATSETSAIFEFIEHNIDNQYLSENADIFIQRYQTKNEIKVCDLNRWKYITARQDYTHEYIMINQHITCPCRPWSPWLYLQTQIIADYFLAIGLEGIQYQTPIAHLMGGPTIYGTPSELLNIALFFDPNECQDRFIHENCMEINITEYINFYKKNMNEVLMQSKIRARNDNEHLAGCLHNNPEYTPTLNILTYE